MRQRNQIDATSCTRDIEFATDHVLQLSAVDELNDRESPDGNDETRLQNSNLIIHPRPAVAYLIWRWDAVGAAGIFAGETAADGGEIDLRSNGGFVHSAKLFEPTEECFASSVRKRSFQHWFPRTGRLPNNHYVAQDCSAGTNVETTVCAHCWQNTLPLVRTILRNGRSRRSIEDLFRRRLPLFPRQKFRRHRPRPSAR